MLEEFLNTYKMYSKSRSCYLLHTETKRKIFLPHKQSKQIGRNEETQVQDLFVSKQQINCTADVENCQVQLKAIGRAISGIDGYAIVKDKTYSVGHGHRFQLRLGYDEFEIIFEPPPKSTEERIVHVAKKQKIDQFSISSVKNYSDSDKSVSSSNTNKWENIDNKELFIYTPVDCQSMSKIAAFDVDGTIIKTKSGARFPKNKDDWEFYFHDIPQKLKKLIEEHYKIVFFTNQSGVGKDEKKIKAFKSKIENIVNQISLPIQVYIATGKTTYRKPLPGMWNTLVDSKNDGLIIDLNNSFYVGDAAGREKNWAPKRNKDHSCADRLFALNIGIKFYTPEEYFLKSKPKPYVMPKFDPRNLPTLRYPDIKYDKPHVILMVGNPGSGKSYFCNKVLIPNHYAHINRDKLKTAQKCVQSLEENLQLKKNCVVDNTNVDKESRARFIEVAKNHNVSCYCFVMSTTLEHSKHNNKFREFTDKSHVPVSEIIISSLNKKFQEPELSEGFKEIVHIPFIPKFDNPDHEKLYKMFLLEK